MNDLNLVLQQIVLHPEDDTVRLAYADLIQERGEPGDEERAEFVRVQIKIGNEHDCECAPGLFVVPGCRVCERIKPFRYRQNKLLTEICDDFRPKCGFSWGVVSGQNGTSDGPISWVWRGFVEGISCSAETFLRHADELIWHPDQKVQIPMTFGERSEYSCDVCGNVPNEFGTIEHGKGCYAQDENGGGTSRVDLPQKFGPRPCPPTAQPVRRVVLTSWEGHPEVFEDQYLEDRYPGVKFVLPELHVGVMTGSGLVSMVAGAPIRAGQMLTADPEGRAVPATGTSYVVGTAAGDSR